MEQLVKSIELENGQRLDIFDASKKIAGDRWQVTLVGRMVISANDIFSENKTAEPPVDVIQQALGDTVLYETQKQRNFISQTEKPAVFKQLIDTLIEFSGPYLAHPEFPKRFIIKKYNEYKKRFGQ